MKIEDVCDKIVKLITRYDWWEVLGGLTEPADYITSKGKTITIDTTRIKPYNLPSEFENEQMDKFLKEFIYAMIPESQPYTIKFYNWRADND